MIDHIYTLPVYRRVLQFAYMSTHDWADSKHQGPRPWLESFLPRVNLGRCTGKTTVAVEFAQQFSDVLLVTRTQALADNITRRNPGVRAFSRHRLDKLDPDHFQSTQPLFLFDDVTSKDTLDLLLRFRPTRFIHLGVWA